MLIEIKALGVGGGFGSYLFDMDDVQMVRGIEYTNHTQYSICVHGQWITNITEEDIRYIKGYMKGMERDKKIEEIIN